MGRPRVRVPFHAAGIKPGTPVSFPSPGQKPGLFTGRKPIGGSLPSRPGPSLGGRGRTFLELSVPEAMFVNFALTLLAAGCIGLVGAHLKLRSDLSDLRLRVAENYANKGDISKVEATLQTMAGEMQSVLKALYKIEAHMTAGQSHGDR